MNVAQETLGLRRAGLSPALSLLMSAFALPIPPARVTPHLRRPTERSPTIQTLPSTHFALRERNASARRCSSQRRSCLTDSGLTCEARSSGAPESAISVPSLSPVTSSAQDDSTSELLRFL